MTLLVSSESKRLVWIGTGCGNVSAQSCFYWWLNGIDDEDGHEDDDNNDKHDNNVDNNDNDDDDDDDDSHPAPCNNRGSSVATLASPGISQMRLLCLTDNTSHPAQRRFFRIYSASQTTTQLLMCDNHTRKIKYSLLHGLHLQCIFVMAKSYKKQILPFFMWFSGYLRQTNPKHIARGPAKKIILKCIT